MYKKSVFLFSCILLACMAISCNHGKNKPVSVNAPKDTSSVNSPRANINGNLYILYLSQSEMQGLLNSTAGTAADDKLIFQFFYDKNGTLDLNAWPKSSGTFPYQKDLFLHETTVSCPCIDATCKNVHLGNVRIGPVEYNKLAAVVTQFQYFIFVPCIKSVDTTDKYCYIVYNIYGDSSIPTTCPYPSSSALKSPTLITNTNNPSPPY